MVLPAGLIEIQGLEYPAPTLPATGQNGVGQYRNTGSMLFWNLNKESIELADGTIVAAGELAMKNGRPLLVDGKDAIKAWIIKVLNTEKGRDEIYVHEDVTAESASAAVVNTARGLPAGFKLPAPITFPMTPTDYPLESPGAGGQVVGVDPLTGQTVRHLISDIISAGEIAVDIHGASGKTTPANSDEFALVDSAGSWSLKKLTWANLVATMKTYADGLYAAIGHTHAQLHDRQHAINSASDHTGAGDCVTKNVGTTEGTVAAGDHTHSDLSGRLDVLEERADDLEAATDIFLSGNY